MSYQRRCDRHNRPRPCPECGRAGYGGRRPGQGRKAILSDPVQVNVGLEREELDEALRLHPGMTRSSAVREVVRRGLAAPATTKAPARRRRRGKPKDRSAAIDRLFDDLERLGEPQEALGFVAHLGQALEREEDELMVWRRLLEPLEEIYPHGV